MIRFVFFLIFAGLVAAAQPLPLPGETPWDLKVLKKTPDFQWLSQKGGVHSLAYAGEEYRGKPTRTFAYYASPKTLGKGSDEKGPGIVLVHGGGGAAFENWAELWARRGYAAIAMDLVGHESVSVSRHYTHIDFKTKADAINQLPGLGGG